MPNPGQSSPADSDIDLTPGLKWMVAHVASKAAGCRYCTAHTAQHATVSGISTDKISAIWQFQSNPMFSCAERAALELALAASSSPPCASDAHFTELKRHYTDEEIVEIVSVIALFGWFNRWNDTMASNLEQKPYEFAASHLKPSGWNLGDLKVIDHVNVSLPSQQS